MNVVLVQNVDQLREGGGDPYTFLVLDTLHSLDQNLADDGGEIGSRLPVRNLIQIHEHGNEGSLSVAGHQSDELVLDGLDAALDFFRKTALRDEVDNLLIHVLSAFLTLGDNLLADLLPADVDEGREVGEGKGLTAVLVGGNLSDNLCGDIAGGEEAVGLFNQGLTDDGSVLQHVLQVDQVTIVLLLRVVIGVVEVNDSGFMGLYDILRKENTLCQILADLSGHVVTLGGVDDRVLVGILLLHLFIVLLDQRENTIVRGV